MALSEKQKFSIKNSTARLNFWEGSVRSGKSFVALLRFLQAIKESPPGAAMVVGPSRDSIQRNVIGPLCEWLPIKPPTPKTTQFVLYNRLVHLVGAADERAQRRIQGSTLALCYVDEVSLLPEGFFRMLLSRLSIPGAQLFGTTNPDSPYHWLKREFLDRRDELDIQIFSFRLDDNPSLDPKYVESLKKEYSGMWYERYIEGKWVLADGLVYSLFNREYHVCKVPPGAAKQYIVGIDYGTTNPTSFIMLGHNPAIWPNIWVEKEYYFDSAKEMFHKTDTDYAEDLKRFIDGYNVTAIYMDPSAVSFRTECYRHDIPNLADADNDVISGIRFVSQHLANGTMQICECALHLIREMGAYVWDTKASSHGKDRPLKQHDHACDALRYALYTHFGKSNGEIYTAEDIRNMYMKAQFGEQNLPYQYQHAIPFGAFGR